ncbi:inner membrane protease subunit 2 [Capsaspora owczarzaki ATCC 30864]|uniref:Mitochondrial inner membrane protease subunit n=1 Tax=Capsaspora owczarzaki (strain ATCC 30864) TaxID=595528 RepID=A0A0D2X5C4_CAPO3|nr:inner membrane protease subunit 2 [Capsaspora owczarzaki ATCC 30864]KJE97564.1 inner membrane protease subunit 2 [Capsaspora owczarzaki ATCC 30864]|eukprot:XP_004343260.1 inner membrane protease subunit 2 [Capsaspora owczarzaki ATCC 30864]
MKSFLKAFAVRSLVILPLAITLTDSVASVAGVQGRSMQPTLNPDIAVDHILLDKWSVRDHRHRRGEVVVLWSPDEPTVAVIKRIIALEGDVVKTLSYKDPFVKIPRGHCWVEGDNHIHSRDSNTFGPIPVALIDARATHVIWPPARIQKIETVVSPDRIERYGRAGR